MQVLCSARVAAFAAMFSGCMGATTLVAIWTPEEVLLGADSLDSGTRAGINACKISTEGQVAFAISGLAADAAVGFDATAFARESMRGGGGIEERLSRFRSAARQPLERAIAAIRQDSPADFAWLQQGHPVLQLIVAEQRSDAPVLAVAAFHVAPDGKLADFSKVVADVNSPRGATVIYAGEQAKIRDHIRNNPRWFQPDHIAVVRQLIGLEIAAMPERVNGPIDILSVGTGSNRWVQRKPECGGVNIQR